jgi:hypothetical protein
MMQRQFIPKKTPDFQGKYIPVYILVSYLIVGFVLYLMAPFDWQLHNTAALIFYFCAILVVFLIGFRTRLKSRTYPAKPVNYKLLIPLGTIAALVLLVPATLLYSGKYPWQFMELLADQSDAYSTYLGRLYESNQADRAPVAILRTLIHPLVFSVLPLSIIHWSKLELRWKLCAMAVVACLLITSLARGTDRETFDLVVFIGSCWLISSSRAKIESNGPKVSKKMSRTQLTFLLFLFGSLVIGFYSFFVERKLGRYGGNITSLCIGTDGDICITNQALNLSWLGDWGIFAIGITASYLSAGWYGLSMAMDLDFHSTFGTAFSPLIARIYEGLSGDSSMYVHSYTYRLRALGWSDEYAWSTLMIWFANDVGFMGALVILFFLSMLFGAAWRDAVLARDDRAAIVFVMLFLMFIYLPANNQIGQTLDLSFAFVFWLVSWQFFKTRIKIASWKQNRF